MNYRIIRVPVRGSLRDLSKKGLLKNAFENIQL